LAVSKGWKLINEKHCKESVLTCKQESFSFAFTFKPLTAHGRKANAGLPRQAGANKAKGNAAGRTAGAEVSAAGWR
jgi:hypothetical protein